MASTGTPAVIPAGRKVKVYTVNSVGVAELRRRAFEVLGVEYGQWQPDAASAVALSCGEDVILDVGTGSGKSLCFVLSSSRRAVAAQYLEAGVGTFSSAGASG